jgi:CCR4-NOT transcription complex subunit 1 CAF1-binding domain
VVNNLSPTNSDAKAKELTEMLGTDYWPWFANYMVVKRAAQARALTQPPSDVSICLILCSVGPSFCSYAAIRTHRPRPINQSIFSTMALPCGLCCDLGMLAAAFFFRFWC